MGTQKLDQSEGALWFFTSDDSAKSNEIDRDHRVNVVYADPNEQRYVSISGMAEVSHDRSKMEELWTPDLRTWFPDGLNDPHMSLIRVSIDQAEHWDAPSSKMVHLFGLLKAVATGTPPKDLGDHAKLNDH